MSRPGSPGDASMVSQTRPARMPNRLSCPVGLLEGRTPGTPLQGQVLHRHDH